MHCNSVFSTGGAANTAAGATLWVDDYFSLCRAVYYGPILTDPHTLTTPVAELLVDLGDVLRFEKHGEAA